MPSFIPYGTAGFRTKAADPNLKVAVKKTVMFLIATGHGLFGDSITDENRFGVMITASHNPVDDNGLKVMNAAGEMWPKEVELQDFVNDEGNSFEHVFSGKSALEENIPTIVVGYDTRPSCQDFLTIIREVVKECDSLGFRVNLMELGVCSTPELHWIVKEWKSFGEIDWKMRYRTVTVENILNFVREIKRTHNIDGKLQWFEGKHSLQIDTAYGCGSVPLKAILEGLQCDIETGEIINEYTGIADDAKLNLNCGAEFVQKDQHFPLMTPENDIVYASFDGDADRLVFSFLDDGQFRLIDGDKIATLLAKFVKQRLEANQLSSTLTLGIVQTAYANGASTKYIIDNVFNGDENAIAWAATGVKYLHKKAHEFDIGIYFEANGHGTVLFSDRCHDIFKSLPENEPLVLFSKVINQAVGDAIMDMFAVLCVLAYLRIDIATWSGMYSDFQSLTTKLKIPDRSLIKTTSDERLITSPSEIQESINKLISQLREEGEQDIRTFVRPSGTEDVVRIYAEGRNKVIVEKIENSVRSIVEKYFEAS